MTLPSLHHRAPNIPVYSPGAPWVECRWAAASFLEKIGGQSCLCPETSWGGSSPYASQGSLWGWETTLGGGISGPCLGLRAHLVKVLGRGTRKGGWPLPKRWGHLLGFLFKWENILIYICGISKISHYNNNKIYAGNIIIFKWKVRDCTDCNLRKKSLGIKMYWKCCNCERISRKVIY